MTYHQILFLSYAALMVLMSLSSFSLFMHDKKLAISEKTRIKEKTLLYTAVLNGAFGAFFGRLCAHHKTNKAYFSITIYFALIMQSAVLVLLAIFAFAI